MGHTSVAVKLDSVVTEMVNAPISINADMELISAIGMQFFQILSVLMTAFVSLDSMVMVSIVMMMMNVLMEIITALLKMKVVTAPTDLANTNVNVVKATIVTV